MKLKSKVGNQEISFEIKQNPDESIKIEMNGQRIGDLLADKELIQSELGCFLLRLSFYITEIE